MLPTLRLAVFLVFFWALPALAQSPAVPAWIGQMREGGFVIVMRHSATHADQVDAKPLDPSDIVHQRQLNDQGRATARIMGAALHSMEVPVSAVQTSLYHRAVETGTLLGYGNVSATDVLTEGGMAPGANGVDLRKLTATPPPVGKNVILVTHKPNIVSAFGKDWSDVSEGEASIFRPDGKGGFTLVARVLIQDWTRLAQAAN
jgi:phosphohistidine phosphatase SixA